ncbi:MAG: ABC transporter ATP-binding protein [Actinomycetota bacterium]
MMALLEVRDLRTGYGHVPVLHGVDLTVHTGETAVILGLNGAGKTTTMMTVAGLLRRWGGTMQYDGEAVGPREDSTHLVRRGLVLVPEGRRVFPGLTVHNNLRLGAWPKRKEHSVVAENEERVYEVFPRLSERKEQLAGTLSGGEQQMLAIARGMMASPRLLMIDEASLGLSPKLAGEVFETIGRINREGVTVLLVEQNAGVLRIATRAFIMQKGRIIFEGAGADVLQQDDLRTAYLGA